MTTLSKITVLILTSFTLAPIAAYSVTVTEAVKTAGADAAAVFADAGAAASPIISAVLLIIAGFMVYKMVKSMMS